MNITKPVLFTAALGAMVVSTTMNAKFGFSLGKSLPDAYLIGGFLS